MKFSQPKPRDLDDEQVSANIRRLRERGRQVAAQVRTITRSQRRPDLEELWGDRIAWNGTHYNWVGLVPTPEEEAKAKETLLARREEARANAARESALAAREAAVAAEMERLRVAEEEKLRAKAEEVVNAPAPPLETVEDPETMEEEVPAPPKGPAARKTKTRKTGSN